MAEARLGLKKSASMLRQKASTKSTGSVSRSKARALAHRAAVDSKVIPAEAIKTPAVLPPPPPKAPTRESVVLREAQPLSGGKSPQHSGPSVPIVLTEVPQAKGETPPQGRVKGRPQDTEEILTTSRETSPHNKGKKRPQAPDCEGTEKTRTKQGAFNRDLGTHDCCCQPCNVGAPPPCKELGWWEIHLPLPYPLPHHRQQEKGPESCPLQLKRCVV